MNAIALAHGPWFVEGVKRYRRKFFIETSFFLKYREMSARPAAVPCISDLERVVFPLLESGNMRDIVDAAYTLGCARENDVTLLRRSCVERAPDLVDVIDGLVWIVREEWAEDPRARAKALKKYLYLRRDLIWVE